MAEMVRTRLDRVVVERGLAATRSRARDLILRGCVTVDGMVSNKPGQEVGKDVVVGVSSECTDYVSRGAVKLTAALAHFGFEAQGRVALDVGASTGGFTQVLLQAGATRVYAVDVGRGQLDARIAGDERVISLEATDARTLSSELVPEPVDAIVADVSFISLTKVLPVPLSLASANAWLVALVKPQFEAGRQAVGKGGVVRDAADRERSVETVREWIAKQPGWTVNGVIDSPIVGGSGNQEFLLGAVHRD
jgi:23S rRNA (cytidine1920-2'-O)/16S rRNA (cytidine1409-2'-O)-methyltransferase